MNNDDFKLEDYEPGDVITIKSEKGDKGDKGEKGEPGHTPVKWKDYFTPSDIIVLKNGIKKEVTPKKGVDYFDGQDADEIRITRELSKLIPTKKEILAGIKVPEASKFDEEALLKKVKKLIPKEINTEDVIKELKAKQYLEPKDIKGMPINMGDMRWHGGGLSTISHDDTLTGSGTPSSPLSVIGGGGNPGGDIYNVQFNDGAGGFGGSDDSTLDPLGNFTANTITTNGNVFVGGNLNVASSISDLSNLPSIVPNDRILYAPDGITKVLQWDGTNTDSPTYWFDSSNSYRLTGDGSGLTGLLPANITGYPSDGTLYLSGDGTWTNPSSMIPVDSIHYLYDTAMTPLISVDGVARRLYADDGLLSLVDFSNSSTGGNYYFASGVLQGDGSGLTGILTVNEKDALNNSNLPSSSNPFATLIDLANINFRYYLLDTASGVSTYKNTALTDPDLPEASVSATTVANNEEIQSWISPSGLDLTTLVAGIYSFRITAEQTGGSNSFQLYFELYERASGGAETLILTSDDSSLITVRTSIEIIASLAADYVPVSTSRLVVKAIARVTGGGSDPDVTLYYLGSTGAHLSTPTNVAILNESFLAIDGSNANQNVDIGAYKNISTGVLDKSLTDSQLVATDVSKNLVSLSTSTYPSLTELSYVKGVTSSIQTQLNNKQPLFSAFTANKILYGNGTNIPATTSTLAYNASTGFVGIGVASPLAQLHLGGNISASAWTTNGIGLRYASATYTDTSSSGTVTNLYVHQFASPTLAASTPTTYTQAAVLNVFAPIAGTNVTITNPYTLWCHTGIARIDGKLGLGAVANPLAIWHVGGNISQASWTNISPTVHWSGNILTDTTGSGTIPFRASQATMNPGTLASINPVTITNAATFYMAGSPAAGTNTTIVNAVTLYVNSGNSYFGGNIGLGTGNTAPNYLLTAASNDLTTSQIGLRSQRTVVTSGSMIGGTDYISNDTDLVAPGTVVSRIQAIAAVNHTGANLTTDLVFSSTNVTTFGELMRLRGTGNLGIGTAAPAGRLDVRTNSNGFQRSYFMNDSSGANRRQDIQIGTNNSVNEAIFVGVDQGSVYGSGVKAYIDNRTFADFGFANNGSVVVLIDTAGIVTFSNKVINSVPQNLKNYTVATLPTGVRGDIAYVTDATAPTYLGALVGGGAVVCPVFFNGTAWLSA